LIEDESIEFVGSNVALRASPMLPSCPEGIVVVAIVIIVEHPVAATHLVTRHAHATVATSNESTQEPVVRFCATRALS
jgi:hypothetical protein